MSKPSSHDKAAQIARSLLERSQPGPRKTSVAAHLVRVSLIADAIWRRFNVGPYQWRAKHLRWYLDRQCADLAATTRYDRWRTIRAAIVALGQHENFAPFLKGPWLRPTGDGKTPLAVGRPAKLPGRGRQKSTPRRRQQGVASR